MKVQITYIMAIFLAVAGVALGQFPQVERNRQKMEKARRAEEEKGRTEGEAAKKNAYPPAKMNIDVRMVLTKTDVKDFAAAETIAISRVTDGDPLWLYIKFNGTLDRYVHRVRETDGRERSILFVEIGPMGEMTAKNHYILEFEKVDLTLSELKISLAPGAPGHIRAMPIFLRNAANLKSGMWNNEVRITDRPSLPRGPHDYLAKSNITLDFSKGLSKYPRMAAEYNSLVLRGTVDIRTVPTPGTYAEKMLRTDVIEKLAGEQIYPSTLYFAGDGWAEYSESPMAVRQYRNIFAAFLYKRGNDCLYGVAEVVQTYDPGTNGYGNTSITFQKDLKTVCRGPN